MAKWVLLGVFLPLALAWLVWRVRRSHLEEKALWAAFEERRRQRVAALDRSLGLNKDA